MDVSVLVWLICRHENTLILPQIFGCHLQISDVSILQHFTISMFLKGFSQFMALFRTKMFGCVASHLGTMSLTLCQIEQMQQLGKQSTEDDYFGTSRSYLSTDASLYQVSQPSTNWTPRQPEQVAQLNFIEGHRVIFAQVGPLCVTLSILLSQAQHHSTYMLFQMSSLFSASALTCHHCET